ncbi:MULTISPECIES: DUF742 domain-containing protein [Streptomyces]|uniref:DUF742 domain-containing protein n=1 Tax=Streptomyces TaxID=1883 RepID=UPI001D1324FE|nr:MULTISPECIES: DUF742 domain-containing protein [Streptomyces]
MSGERPRDGLVRSYVVTGGRSTPSRNHFDAITLITCSAPGPGRGGLSPEQRKVLDLLAPSAQSVAELGARLHLPLAVLRVLLADLMSAGHITTQRPITKSDRLDRKLLEEVLAGLQRL